MDKHKTWEQQEGEPHEWYNRFLIFKLQGPSRSLTAAYNEEGIRKGREKSKSAPPGWRTACKDWNWKGRAQAWDGHQQNKSEQRWENKQKEWEQRQEDRRNKAWELYESLIEKAEEMLKLPIVTKTIEHEGSVVIINPTKWTFKDVATYLETAQKLADFSTGKADKTMSELEALQVLVNAGWIPDEIIDVATTKMDEARDAVGAAFRGMNDGV